jgi:hypothetical protein
LRRVHQSLRRASGWSRLRQVQPSQGRRASYWFEARQCIAPALAKHDGSRRLRRVYQFLRRAAGWSRRRQVQPSQGRRASYWLEARQCIAPALAKPDGSKRVQYA